MTLQSDLSRAQQLLQQGQYGAVLKTVKTAQKRHGKSPVLCNMAGIALGATGKHRDALGQFNLALKMAPDYHDARKNMAQSLLLMGDAGRAVPVLTRLVDLTPGDSAVWYLLAQAQANTGHPEDAIRACDQAITLAPDQARNFNLRALQRDRLGQLVEALQDYEAALKLDPDNVETLTNISLSLARQMRTQDALDAVQRAVSLSPTHVGARMRLAVLLVATGDTPAAIGHLQSLLEHDPEHAGALEHLAGLQSAEQNVAIDPLVQKALKRAPKRSEARAGLEFARATILRQVGDPHADDQLATANHEMARLLPYDAKSAQRLTDKLLARFENGPTTDEPSDHAPVPIFVLGLPRSGTTLTEAILGAHPSVAALGERAAAGILLKPVIDDDLPFDADAVCRFRDGDARLLPVLPQGTAAYVDKMPENYRLIGFLKTAYPNCRIVALRRDPRDVALSMWRGHFSGTALSYTYDFNAMAHHFNMYARAMTQWKQLFPNDILELRYEDIVADVTAASRTLAEFCNLDWVPEMAHPENSGAQVLTASATQLRGDVHQRSVGKWRNHPQVLAPFVAGLDPDLWPEIAT